MASVVESSSDDIIAEVADCVGCGHCVDMKEPRQNDPPSLVEVRRIFFKCNQIIDGLFSQLRSHIDRFLTAWIES